MNLYAQKCKKLENHCHVVLALHRCHVASHWCTDDWIVVLSLTQTRFFSQAETSISKLLTHRAKVIMVIFQPLDLINFKSTIQFFFLFSFYFFLLFFLLFQIYPFRLLSSPSLSFFYSPCLFLSFPSVPLNYPFKLNKSILCSLVAPHQWPTHSTETHTLQYMRIKNCS